MSVFDVTYVAGANGAVTITVAVGTDGDSWLAALVLAEEYRAKNGLKGLTLRKIERRFDEQSNDN